MSSIRLLSSALDGQTLTLGATQDGLSDSQVIANWGNAETGGPIAILLDRTDETVAPDRVRFTVDLTLAAFDSTSSYDPIADVTYTNGYNPALHNLIFLWDLGDTGTWHLHERTPDTWRTRRFTKGPVVQHVYPEPGDYTVRLTVIEPHTGKTSSAETTFTVLDQETVYPGDMTVCINPIGDTDFTGAPAGADLVNMDDFLRSDPVWTDRYRTKRRWLFKRGASFTTGMRIREESAAGHLFGAYGNGDMPVLNMRPGNAFNFDILGDDVKRDYRICDLHIQNTFDPTSQTVSQFGATNMGITGNGFQVIDLVVHNIKTRGLGNSVININQNNRPDANFRYAFNALDVTDSGGRYNIIIGQSENEASTVSLTGSRITQNPLSISDDTNITANIRINRCENTYIAFNDLFNISENNPSIKVCEDNTVPQPDSINPQLVNITSNTIEANSNIISIGIGMKDRAVTQQNVVIDGNILCGNWDTQYVFQCCCTGITIRNTLSWQPNVPSVNGLGTVSWFRFELELDATGGQDVPIAPVQLYNNTFINDREDANNNNGNITQLMTDFNNQFTAAGVFSEQYNIIHQPNLGTPQTSFAPLGTDVIFNPRSTVGRISGADLPNPVPDTSFANTAQMLTHAPLTGSAALGSATMQPRSFLDLLGSKHVLPMPAGAWITP